MVVPALALPAIAAGAMYMNAKHNIGQDAHLLKAYFSALIRTRVRERKDRLSLFYILEERAHDKKYADKTYLIFEGARWTYKQVYDIALSYGTFFKNEYGVQAKDIVAVDFGNSEQFIFVWLGLWAIGARPAFLNYNLTGKPLQHCIKVSTTKLVLVDPQFEHIVNEEGFQAELPGIRFETLTEVLQAKAVTTPPVRVPDADRSTPRASDMSLLIYTSGTTGLPKPAVVSWLKCIISSVFPNTYQRFTSKDTFYTSMPLYHSAGSLLGCMNTLGAGGAICIGRKFSTKLFWPEVRAAEATIIQYVGETCRYLLAAAPLLGPNGEDLDKDNKVRVAFGNGLRPDIWNKFKERFDIPEICEFYAATEGAGGAWNLSRNDFTKAAIGKTGTIASFLMNKSSAIVEVDIVTEEPLRLANGFCRQVPVGAPGELLHMLDAADIEAKFQGYFNSPGATNSKILRNVLTKDDAWFRTGDVVSRDSEGRTFFVDRIGDTFRWKSENVSTNEVSEVLGYHPSVLEANVYGVELPHHDGRAGCAAVVLSEGISEALMEGLATHVNLLPKFAQPIFLRITKGGPVTGTNKQQKHVLRKEGVDLEAVRSGDQHEDQLYWLQNGKYVPFTDSDLERLRGGGVKL